MLFKFARLLLICASFAFLFLNLLSNWQQAKLTLTTIDSWYLLLSFMSIFPVFVLAGVSWHLVIRQLGGISVLHDNLPIWIQANLTRYVPGAIWQYLSKFYVSVQSGLSRAVALAALVLEIVFVIIAAGLLSILFVPWQEMGIDAGIIWILAPLAVLPIFSQPIFSVVVNLIKKVLRIDISGKINWPWEASLKILPLYILNFLLNGLSLVFLIYAFGYLSEISFWQVVGIFSLSWLIGYLTVFAPAGLGVTEVSLAYLLSFFIPFPSAVLISIIFRLLLIVAEVSTFMLVFAARSWKLF
ncbi:flippase-like domain-containing protein [Candidatus Daviesbacteria bacterium]|nr:flippase-like domain-containing protein [Candidatus Daviesbacteria bacterium]